MSVISFSAEEMQRFEGGVRMLAVGPGSDPCACELRRILEDSVPGRRALRMDPALDPVETVFRFRREAFAEWERAI